ncbi:HYDROXYPROLINE-RICH GLYCOPROTEIN-LIKE [Salix purpurea]|uniref:HYDROXYPROLINE-RICH GLYCOPROTEIN-LIKE n=1 Tax=Salix purpurea TaxID=77065 RepID=A0A9Q0THD2_SALPP|nr:HYDROXYPROLINE-RICH GLYCOPROTEIN-LIKE [Salix purpurea]
MVHHQRAMDIGKGYLLWKLDKQVNSYFVFLPDPFHEVKRKRDKKKENMSYRGSVDSRKHSENFDQGMRPHTFSDRNARRGGYTRPASPGTRGINREFRVVRDNRVNQNTSREPKPALLQGSTSAKEQGSGVVTKKGYAFSGSFTKF